MALSSSWDFTIQRDYIINMAFRLIGLLGEDQTASTTRIGQASQALNMMVKGWQAEGIGLWMNRELVLFPQADVVKYGIGEAGMSGYSTYCIPFEDYVKTEVSTAAAAADTSFVVDSVTGMSASDYLGIETDNGDIHWTTINAIDTTTYTISFATALDYAAAVDNHVYSGFSTYAQRPLEIIQAWTRDSEEIDTPIEIMSLQEYRLLSNKTTETTRPTGIAFNPLPLIGIVYVWPEPSDMKTRIHLIAKYPFQDFDVSTSDIDFPVEWLEPIVYNLALRIAAEYGRTPSQLVTAIAIESYQRLKDFDREQVSVKFKPNPRSYRK